MGNYYIWLEKYCGRETVGIRHTSLLLQDSKNKIEGFYVVEVAPAPIGSWNLFPVFDNVN